MHPWHGLEVARDYIETMYHEALREVVSLRAELAGRMEIEAERDKSRDAATELLARLGIKEPCNAYYVHNGEGVCWGTKECEACACGGDKTRCTHYEATTTLPVLHTAMGATSAAEALRRLGAPQ